jgi:cytochrome c5
MEGSAGAMSSGVLRAVETVSRKLALRTGFAVVMFAVPLVATWHLAAAQSSGAARIRFDTVEHDFGKVPSDQKVSLKWTFHNDGDAPLEILNLKPSCACTATAVRSDPVPPGGSGVIEVTFDPVGQFGQVRKSVAVTSNDPEHKIVILRMKADVSTTSVERVAAGHPPISGQSLLIGECASCHARPAADKQGHDLFAAICAMCHGARGEGGRAPSLREPGYLASHDDKALAEAIAYGTVNPKMPGFVDVMGGPLSHDQVESLVRLLRSWGPGIPAVGAKTKDSK